MPIISIIVPVYNVEQYLERCVKSLIDQNISDREIILVDDGSTDHSGIICDKLKDYDRRIRVMHKKNGGLSSARNAGMNIAVGKYIGFVDSDDDVCCEMFSNMVSAAEKYEADFVMSDYIRILKDGSQIHHSTSLRDGFYDKEDIKKEIYPALLMGEDLDYGPVLTVWNCIYRHSFLNRNHIQFANDIKWSEDNLFSAVIVYYSARFYYLKGEYYYHYYQNSGSITNSYRAGAWEVYKRMNEKMKHLFLSQQEYDFTRQLELHLIYYACHVIGMECRNAENRKDAKEKIKEILDDEKLIQAFRLIGIPYDLPWKLKMQLLLMKQRKAGILSAWIRRICNA